VLGLDDRAEDTRLVARAPDGAVTHDRASVLATDQDTQ
jgi:hypothetical protein